MSAFHSSYPTKEQALAAAFLISDVGDEVFEHQETCSGREEDGSCECDVIVWRRAESGWEQVI